MKLIIDNRKYYIKDDIILPSNFDSMSDHKKNNYIFINNLLHREDGPAFINSTGPQAWYLNGRLHRLNGPTVIWSDEYKSWYIDDIRVDEKTYKKIQSSTKEDLLVYMIQDEYKDYLPLIEYELNKK